MKHYPAVKRNELLIYTTSWINLRKHYAKCDWQDVRLWILWLHCVNYWKGKYVIEIS